VSGLVAIPNHVTGRGHLVVGTTDDNMAVIVWDTRSMATVLRESTWSPVVALAVASAADVIVFVNDPVAAFNGASIADRTLPSLGRQGSKRKR
jgi:hypothetical protein